MNNYILYSGTTSVTGKALAEALGIPGGTSCGGERYDNLLRWGSGARVRFRPHRVINSLNAVRNSVHKLNSLRMLREAGVPVPDYYTPDEEIPVESFPVLGRCIWHTQGKDIVLCLQRDDVRRSFDSEFFVRYVPVFREFRVHVIGEEIVKVHEKILTDVEMNKNNWIRNHGNGYTFRKVRPIEEEKINRIKKVSVDAVHTLGLHFGAVDVILSDNGLVYVLEVNTGPSLSNKNVERYAALFRKILFPEE